MSVPFVILRRHALIALAAVVALLALTFLMSSTAKADPAYPPSTNCALSVSGTGSSVTLTGSGYPANSTVTLSNGSTVHTDADGSFTTTTTVSGNSVTASSGDTSCSLGTDAQTVHRSSNGTQGQHLGIDAATKHRGGTASTGFAAITASAIAVALLGGGLLFVLVGRRRRQV